MKSYRIFLTSCFATICLSVPGVAQDEGEEVEAVPEVIEEEPESGDVLVLKNGDRITGFQIMRATHRHYILEGLYDPETDESLEIKVTRGQVKEVIRDDIEPADQRAEAKKKALARQRTTVEGARMSDKLYGLLERVIGDPPLDTTGLNLIQVIGEVNKRVEDVMKVAPPLQNFAGKWKGTIAPDTTFAMFLDNEVSPNYGGIEVAFDENIVRIRPKKLPGAGAPPPPGLGGRGGPPPAGLGGRGGPPPEAPAETNP